MSGPNIQRLRAFVQDFAALLEHHPTEETILAVGAVLLERLVAVDDWLPEAYAQPSPDRYQQYLLHCDSTERFSVVSFVWGPGQQTPIHNHTVWGLVGMLRGAETSQAFAAGPGDALAPSPAHRLEPGEVEAVSPRIGDVHQVSNAFDNAVSVSIHVYGANIGAVRRSTFDAGGAAKPFISGYANKAIPNLWDVQANKARL